MDSPSWITSQFPMVTLVMPNGRPFMETADSRSLAWAVVDTLREPLLVLDRDLHVVAASGAFDRAFGVDRTDVLNRPVFALCGGEWDIPDLRLLLDSVLVRRGGIGSCEIERAFSGRGVRTLLLHAREASQTGSARNYILLSVEDVSEQRAADRAAARMQHRTDILLEEAQHRIANSLQVIASILLLKARRVQSPETRKDLQDAHRRILSVATVQQQLYAARNGQDVPLAPYLARLCKTLNESLVGDGRGIAIEVQVAGGKASATEAVSIGLIVTELVINALKHAFVEDRTDGRIVVAYDIADAGWRLAVRDNGIGKPPGRAPKITPGLGTSIVEALARQLDSRVEIARRRGGTAVSIVHGSFAPRRTKALLAVVR